MTQQTTKLKNKEGTATLKLLLIVAFAFFAAVVFRRSAGILTMTPLAFLFCGIAAFINFNLPAKISIFVLTVFSVNTVEQKNMQISIMFSALCLLACLVFEFSAHIIRKHKKRGFFSAVVSAILCISLSFYFVGNPFYAISANSVLNEYTDSKYPSNENAVLGEFEFSSIYYDFETKAYSIDAVSTKYPTENAAISLNKDIIFDGFKSIMEEKLCEPYVLELTEFLRGRFPNDSFGIRCDGITALPGEAIFSFEAGKLYGDLIFEITLSGVQSANLMLEKVDRYVKAIDNADIKYAKLIFKSGIGQWYRRSVTVDSTHTAFTNYYKLERVHMGTSNLFNRYVSNMISIN